MVALFYYKSKEWHVVKSIKYAKISLLKNKLRKSADD